MTRIGVIARWVWLELIRRKDLYVLFLLLGALLLTVISLDIFGLGGMTRYVKDLGLLLAWVFSIALSLTLAARQLPQEERSGTLFAVLSKPVTRAELLAGKWLGVWAGGAAATLCFYVLLAGVVWARGGSFPAATAVQAFALHAAAIGVMAALAIALSTRLTGSAALTLSALVLLACVTIVPEVPRLALHSDPWRARALELLYYAAPHFELFDLRQRLVHEWGPISWGLLAGLVAYALVWSALLLTLAWLGYRRRFFRRGDGA